MHPELGTYRPLLALIFSLIIPLFGTNFFLYQTLNTVVEIGCAIVMGAIAYRLSRGNIIVAVCCILAFIFSRFAYYSIGQVFGLMEGLGLFLTLLLVADVESVFRKNEPVLFARAALWFGLCLFVDERYVVTLPFLLLAVLLYSPRLEPRQSSAFCAIPIAIVALNIAIRTFFFRYYLVEVSGGPLILNMASITDFALSGLLNVVGFNIGPVVFSAEDLSSAGPIGYLLGFLVAIPFGVAALEFALGSLWSDGVSTRMRSMLLGLTLFVSLLISACISTRQEFRWLYAPYAIALLGFAGATGYFPDHRRALTVCSGLLVASTIASAIFYRTYIGNIYFFGAERIANGVAAIVEKRPGDPVVLLTHHDDSIEQWDFMSDMFFDEFGVAQGRLFYLDDISELANLGLPLTWPSPTVVDIQGLAIDAIDARATKAATR